MCLSGSAATTLDTTSASCATLVAIARGERRELLHPATLPLHQCIDGVPRVRHGAAACTTWMHVHVHVHGTLWHRARASNAAATACEARRDDKRGTMAGNGGSAEEGKKA